MILICFNEDECNYRKQIPLEGLDAYDLTKPFVKCPECNSLALIAHDDFDINNLDQNLLISSILKLSKGKNDE